MRIQETSMGGDASVFPTTTWSQVLAAGDPDCPENRARVEQLARAYWKPVYSYIRASWANQIEDSKDLTQAFFTYLLESGILSRVRPERGSFRGYLKTALKHFLIDAHRADQVRRPIGRFRSLDGANIADIEAPPEGVPPEDAYDREWFRSLLDAGTEDLRLRLECEGKPKYYAAFQLYCLAPASDVATADARPTYESVASSLGLTESDVRNYLHLCRTMLKELLRARILEYIADPADVGAELAEVLRR